MTDGRRQLTGLVRKDAPDLSWMQNPKDLAETTPAPESAPEEPIVISDVSEDSPAAPENPVSTSAKSKQQSVTRKSKQVSKTIETGAKVPVSVTMQASIIGRARTAYRATSYLEGDSSMSEFIEKAVEREVQRREEQYNRGQLYPVSTERLPGGRPLGR